jgi:hypothetical protein
MAHEDKQKTEEAAEAPESPEASAEFDVSRLLARARLMFSGHAEGEEAEGAPEIRQVGRYTFEIKFVSRALGEPTPIRLALNLASCPNRARHLLPEAEGAANRAQALALNACIEGLIEEGSLEVRKVGGRKILDFTTSAKQQVLSARVLDRVSGTFERITRKAEEAAQRRADRAADHSLYH